MRAPGREGAGRARDARRRRRRGSAGAAAGGEPRPELRVGRRRACVSASAAASPGGTCSPSTPSSTSSAMPPMPEQITGRPAARASWITSGAFSHQIEGTTIQSACRISADHVGRGRRARDAGRPAPPPRASAANSCAEAVVGPAEPAVQRHAQVARPSAARRRRAAPARPCAARCCRRRRSGCGARARARGVARRGPAARPRSAPAGSASGSRPQATKRSRRNALGAMKRSTAGQERQQVRPAQRVAGGALLGKAAPAAVGLRAAAARALAGGQQQPVVGADQLVVVQGQHDAGTSAPAAAPPGSPRRRCGRARAGARCPGAPCRAPAPSAATQPSPSSRVIEKRS